MVTRSRAMPPRLVFVMQKFDGPLFIDYPRFKHKWYVRADIGNAANCALVELDIIVISLSGSTLQLEGAVIGSGHNRAESSLHVTLAWDRLARVSGRITLPCNLAHCTVPLTFGL